MNQDKIVEPHSLIAAGITLIFCFILFYSNSAMFFGSLMAAILAAALMWLAYVIVRLIILAFRK